MRCAVQGLCESDPISEPTAACPSTLAGGNGPLHSRLHVGGVHNRLEFDLGIEIEKSKTRPTPV
jgi:hypothetical protein